MKQFGYLNDPLCWISLGAYAFNRLLLKPHLHMVHGHLLRTFLHSHFDDLLLIPVALPVMLWIQRIIGLRQDDLPPRWSEMFLHLAAWAVMCKFTGPLWLHIGTPDLWDLPVFAMGGIIACLWWNRAAGKSARLYHEF